MTIGKKISLGFAGVVLLAAGLGSFAVVQFRDVLTDAHRVEAAMPSLDAIADIQQTARLSYALTLEHVLSSTPDEAARIEQELKQSDAVIEDARKRYDVHIENIDERNRFVAMTETAATVKSIRNEIIALGRQQKDTDALAMVRSRLMPATDAFMKSIGELWEYNQADSVRTTGEIVTTADRGRWMTILSVLGAVLAGVTVALLIVRSVSRSLARMAGTLASGAEQTTAAASQVSSASQSLAQGASEQAASLEETSASLEEMSSMTRKNAETARQAATFAAEARAAADKGNIAMNKMSSAIADIQKSTTETAKIVKTIDGIAFQTNLLALNAAVEAARAGEAGKGFAVVAEEVRNLAKRSADAAKTTSELIEGSVNNANNGVSIVEEVDQTLLEITSASEKVNALIAEIAAASNEQAQGIGQVNTAVSQIDKVTQSNAAAAEQSAAASEELSAQTDQLSVVVTELMAMVGTAAQSTTPHASYGFHPSHVPHAIEEPKPLPALPEHLVNEEFQSLPHASRIAAAFQTGR